MPPAFCGWPCPLGERRRDGTTRGFVRFHMNLAPTIGVKSLWRTHGLLFSLAAAALAFPGALADAAYRIENVDYPNSIRSSNAAGIAAVAFTPSGSMVIATRLGEVWMRRVGGPWRLFARGFDDPLGLLAESETSICIAHRPELLRARDTDGDGEAETFDVVGGDWGQTFNYHEFVYGLKRDRAGNFYVALALDSQGARNAEQKALYPTLPYRGVRNLEAVLGSSSHRSEVMWRGWVVRITPEGKTEPVAAGFRQSNGIGLSPKDELFVTDNQGDYKPSTGLIHVEKGDFHGHAESLKWEPGYSPAEATMEKLWRRLKTPAVVFPHGELGVSPGEPVWDLSGGKFGPYSEQVFVGDFSRIVIRASLEKVAGAWQGAAFPFLGRNETAGYVSGERLKSGTTRGVFAADGSLYLAATSGQGAGEDGLQRIVWDGKTSPDMLDITLTESGFRITFTRPMSAETTSNPENYEISRFRYYYQAMYGSPRIDEARVTPTRALAAHDGLSVDVFIEGLEPGFIYKFSVPHLRTREQDLLANSVGYYTVNRLRNGGTTVGGTTRLPLPGENTARSREPPMRSRDATVAAGEMVYRLYCTACHQPDGRGVPGGAANFAEDKARLAKSDSELQAVITHGIEAKGMPAFGGILNASQRSAVLAYIREKFGAVKTENSK